ncbi:MAG TPA: extracellular solute-binding protein [Gemmatimonadales bacterium]|nr:extracellular solute-binding protein [Gemmatimonadales bacterium]
MMNDTRAALFALAMWGCTADSAPPLRLATRLAPGDRAIEAARIEVFSSERPDLVIDRVPASRASEPGIDLVRVDGNTFAAARDRVPLLDLAPYLARVDINLKSYDSAVAGAFERGRGVYALPRGASPLVLLFNPALFDSAGIAYPSADWTWDDFLAAAAILTRDSNGDGTLDQWGTYFDPHPAIWLAWIWSGGGDVFCARDVPRATGCLDSRTTQAAIRWYAAWPNEQRIARAWTAGSEQEAFRMFAAGRVAMITVDHTVVPMLRELETREGFRFGFAELPHRDGFAPRTVLRVAAYGIPAPTRRRKLAVQLAAALVDSAAQEATASLGYELPVVPQVLGALAARADSLGCEDVFIGASSHARLPWGISVQKWPLVDALLERMMVRIASEGGGAAEDVVRETARAVDRVQAER